MGKKKALSLKILWYTVVQEIELIKTKFVLWKNSHAMVYTKGVITISIFK